jgi:hypothetical protein
MGCSSIGGGDETGGEDRVGVSGGEGGTGRDFATADLAAGGGTAEFGLVRLRRTTTGFVVGLCERPGMRALFLGSRHNAILCRDFSEYAAFPHIVSANVNRAPENRLYFVIVGIPCLSRVLVFALHGLHVVKTACSSRRAVTKRVV